MNTDNFVGFFTACGFFVSLAFIVIADLSASQMLIYAILITFIFYLIIHIIIMNYIETGKKAMWCFDKERYEEINDYLIDELNDRERRMDAIIEIKREKLVPKSTLKRKKGVKNNERTKAQAA